MSRAFLLGGLVVPALLGATLCPAAPLFAQENDGGASATGAQAGGTLADRAMAAYESGGAAAAEPLFAELALALRTELGADHPDSIVAASNHAYMLLSLNRFAEAEAIYAEVETRSRAVLGGQAPDTLQAINDHALSLEKLGRLAEAEPLYREALEGRRAVLGADDPATALSLNNYALIVLARGRAAEAEPLVEQSLALHRRLYGPDHGDTLLVLNNYAYLLTRLGRHAEAEPLLAQAVESSRRLFGPDDMQTMRILNSHADSLRANGKLSQAFAAAGEVLERTTAHLGKEDPFTLLALNNYATLLSALGMAAKAEPALARALAISTEVNGPKHPDTLRLLNNHAAALAETGKPDTALTDYARVLQIRREVQGVRHPETINAINNYGQLLAELGRIDEAEPLLREAYMLARDVLGERHPATLLQANNFAAVLRDSGRPRDAIELYNAALPVAREVLGPDHPDTLRLVSNLAFALEDSGDYAGAAQLYIDALQGRRRAFGDAHPDTLDSFVAYAELLELVGRAPEAEGFLTDSLALRRDLQGDTNPATANHASHLASLYLASSDTPDKALPSARLAAAASRARSATLGGVPGGDAQLARDRASLAFTYQLLADADWAAQQAEPNSAAQLRAEAFTALQDVLTGSASRAIAQSAARRAAQQSGGLGELARERQDLADGWLALERAMTATLADSGPDADLARTNLRTQLAAIEQRMAAIDERLRRDAPDYFALVRPQALDESQAANLLRSDEAALMLVPTAFGTHVMAVTREGVRWHRSDWSESRIGEAVTRLLWDVGATASVAPEQADRWLDEGDGAYPYDFATAAALYGELVAPVLPALEGKTHVFVMASGALSSLPLGLLVSDIPAGANGDPAVLRSAPWLADRFALLQIPSLQSIRFLRDFRSGAGQDAAPLPFIGFGDPVLGGKAAQRGARGVRGSSPQQTGFADIFTSTAGRGGKGLADIGQLKAMASLPGTATELTAMWEAFGKPGNALHLAGEAREPLVRSSELSATVVAFATHGLLAGEVGGIAEPGLVLTPPEQPSESDDGYLSMSEIAGLRMDADWVILSACNTAAGDGSEGASGLSGLARAFFYAGARNLLASYWPVRDDVAALLTVRTVEIARANPALSRAQAFQQAMREIRDNPSADSETDTWAHPNAWAPFVLVGDR